MSYICKVVEKTAVLLPLLPLSSTAAATATALLTSSFTATVTAISTATLELYLKGTYVTYPYLEYLKYKEQDPIRLPRYLITTRTHMQFLSMILLVN